MIIKGEGVQQEMVLALDPCSGTLGQVPMAPWWIRPQSTKTLVKYWEASAHMRPSVHRVLCSGTDEWGAGTLFRLTITRAIIFIAKRWQLETVAPWMVSKGWV